MLVMPSLLSCFIVCELVKLYPAMGLYQIFSQGRLDEVMKRIADCN